MKPDNRYETAFADHLRGLGVPFVPISEIRRSRFGELSVKSADFLVLPESGRKLVVDVKGRRYPSGSARSPRKVWENWATAEDLEGLGRWSHQLGPNFCGVIVFVYQIVPPFYLSPNTPDQFDYQGETFLLRGADVAEYRLLAKVRSPRWGTVAVSQAEFGRIVRPFSEFFSTETAADPQTSTDQADTIHC